MESLPAAPEQAAYESHAGADAETAQLEGAAGAAGAPQEMAVQTTIPGGAQTGATREGAAPDAAHANEEEGEELAAHSTVAPGGSPTVGAGANDCVPSTASASLAWEVVDAGTNWRANVTGLTLAGRIRINP